MAFKKLREIFSGKKIEKDYQEILLESGLLRKIERVRLENMDNLGSFKLHPSYKEYIPGANSPMYDYDRFDIEGSEYRVDLGDYYFKIRTSTSGVYLSFRDIQKKNPLKRKKINPMKVSDKEVLKWFSSLKKYSKKGR